ncbi:MAG TPA: hypothetical protein VF671_02995 [Pseudomonas sp.]|jgi:hypothetical protein|uniref:hypothetical protein n=1 Tax=Pseudomonas sp. TaxID=306 RepID=UPI002ED88580
MSNKNSPVSRVSNKVPEGLKRHPHANPLSAPFMVDVGSVESILYPCAVAETGAVVRLRAFDGMALGQKVTFNWKGRSSYTSSQQVEDVGRYMDFIVPKETVLKNTLPGELVRAEIYVSVSGISEVSPVNTIHVIDTTLSIPAVTVPEAVDGRFNPDEIPERGLKIVFPQPVVINARWVSYGRDGGVIATVSFAVPEGQDFVYMWRTMLDQTESGGEVRINYFSGNADNILVQSLFTALQVIRS